MYLYLLKSDTDTFNINFLDRKGPYKLVKPQYELDAYFLYEK